MSAGGAAIARWIHLCLNSAVPGSNSKDNINAFFYISHCALKWTKINKKRPGLLQKPTCELGTEYPVFV